MEEEWSVGRGTGACSACGRARDRAAAHYSTLISEPVTPENPTGFRRADFCAACWSAISAELRAKGALAQPPPPPPPPKPTSAWPSIFYDRAKQTSYTVWIKAHHHI